MNDEFLAEHKEFSNIRYDEERKAIVGTIIDDCEDPLEVVLIWAKLPDKNGKVYTEECLRKWVK